MTRRVFVGALAVLLAVGLLVVLPGGGSAQQKVAKIGMSFPLTGADADSADSITKGAQLAIDEINQKGGVAGYKLEAVVFDSATPAAGQYDPAQAATNIRKFIADAQVVALIGPQMSGEGKATSPILSEADLPTITPSSTNPDITDPKFQSQYRPKGKADLLPHGDDRRLPGPEHGQPRLPQPEGQEGLHPGRQRGLRGGDRGQLRAAGEGTEDGGPRPRPARSEGSRLQDHPDQDQGPEPGRASTTAACSRRP